MNIIEKKTIKTPVGESKEYYYQVDPYFEYRRIIGGIAWPAESAGFIVVIGEDYRKDPTLKLRHYRLLDEYEGNDIPALIKKLYDFQSIYKVQNLYGDSNNEMMMKFIFKFNQSLGQRKKGVFVSEAPFIDDNHNFKYYAPQIKKMINRATKSLHFGAHSQLPGKLSSLTAIDVDKAKISDYPPIAALGYAVAGLNEPYFDYAQARDIQNKMIANYNVAGL